MGIIFFVRRADGIMGLSEGLITGPRWATSHLIPGALLFIQCAH